MSNLHKTISAGRKTISFGMSWFTAEEDEQPKKLATQLAKRSQDHFDLMVTRRGEFQQFALASTAQGAKSNSSSAAGIIAEIIGLDSWIYVMEIGNSIWICSGRDGYILPDGDKIYDSVDLAKDAFQQMQPQIYKKIFLPESWQNAEKVVLEGVSSDTQTTDIRDFVSYDAPKWAKLTKFAGTSTLTTALLALLIIAGVGYGGMKYLEPGAPAPTEFDPEAWAEQMRQEEEREIQQVYQTLDSNRPWGSFPPARPFLQTCLKEIGEMPVNPIGYTVDRIYCTSGSIDAGVTRARGYSTWLQEWAKGYPELSVSTETNGDSGYITKEITTPLARGGHDLQKSETFEAISTKIFEIAQIEGAGVTLDQPTVVVLPEYPEYVPMFATGSYQIVTKRPTVWLELMSDYHGLTLDAVSFDLTDKTYTMEGKLYVDNPRNRT
jgi:hypothetical protein